MRIIKIILLSLLFCTGEIFALGANAGKDVSKFANFFANINALKNFELNLIAAQGAFRADNVLKSFASRIQDEGHCPISTFNIKKLLDTLRKEDAKNCPIILPYGNVSATHKEDLYQRKIRMFPPRLTPRLMAFWVDDGMSESEIYDLLNQTNLYCPQTIDYGPFNKDSIIMFVSQNMSILSNLLLHDLLPLSQHPQVLGILSAPGKELLSIWQRVAFQGLKPFKGVRRLQQNFVWAPKNLLTSLHDLVPPLHSFNGEDIIVSAANMNTPLDENGFIPRKAWFPALHYIIGGSLEALDCTVWLRPAVTSDIRLIDEDGMLRGQSRLIHENLVDVAFHGFEEQNYQIGELSSAFLNPYRFTSFIAPNPKQLSKKFVIIFPFTLDLWIALAVSALASATAFSLLSYLNGFFEDGSASNKGIGAFWFVFATLLRDGSNAFQDNMIKIKQGRAFLLVWLLFCLVMSSAYSGNLYSFLSNPLYEEPIDDVAAILRSGLPWKWSRDNPNVEYFVSQSSDPDLKKLWQGHIPLARQRGITLHKLMEPVVRGEYILISSYNFKPTINAIFSPRNSKPLLHHSARPIAEVTISKFSWFFPKLSRWSQLINKYIKKSVEVGMTEKWSQISDDSQTEFFARIYEGSKINNNESERDLRFFLSDVQGTFFLWGIIIGVGIITFLLEKLRAKREKNYEK